MRNARGLSFPACFPSHPGRLATYAAVATAHEPAVHAHARRDAPVLAIAATPQHAPATPIPSAIIIGLVTRGVEIADLPRRYQARSDVTESGAAQGAIRSTVLPRRVPRP